MIRIRCHLCDWSLDALDLTRDKASRICHDHIDRHHTEGDTDA